MVTGVEMVQPPGQPLEEAASTEAFSKAIGTAVNAEITKSIAQSMDVSFLIRPPLSISNDFLRHSGPRTRVLGLSPLS
jgi:hypothetical protein